MSDINWAGLNRGPNIFSEFASGLEYGTDKRRQNERDNLYAEKQNFEIGQARRQQALQDQERTRKTNVGTAVAKGDFAGARTAAEGDFDLLTSIGKLDEDQRKRAREVAKDVGGFAATLKGQPYASRKAIMQQAAPTLKTYGFTDEQLATFDPTDTNLDARIAEATDLETALAEQNRQRDDQRSGQRDDEMKQYRADMLALAGSRQGLAERRESRVAATAGRKGGKAAAPGPKPTGRHY